MTYERRPIAARQPWLVKPYRRRSEVIAGVMLHSTRSTVEAGDDGPRTERWWNNPNNNQGGWGSYADGLLYEDGTQVVCTDPDNEHASWTAGYGDAGTWAAGIHYFQIEIAQGTTDEPFKPAQIDSLAQWVAELAKRYNFPIVRIPFLSQQGIPPRGICTHEDSANGRKSGKSDPGPMFPWAEFLSKTQAYLDGGDAVCAKCDQIITAVFGSEARMLELAQNAPVETRVNSLETNGDTVARAAIAQHEDGHGMVNVPTFNSITITGVGLQVQEED